MPITTYNPSGTLTAGNLKVVLGPTIANLSSPSLAAITASGIEVQCAIENFGTSTDVQTTDRRKLCNKESVSRISSRRRSLDSITITGDATTETALRALLVEDAKIGIIARPYSAYSGELAAADKVWAFNATVASVDPLAVTVTDGEEFAWVVAFADVTRDVNATIAS